MTVDEAIAAFLVDLGLGRAATTVVAYRYALARFREFLDARDALPDRVDGLSIDQVVEFTRWVLAVPETARSRKTADVYIAGLRTFYGYLVREDLRPDLELAKLTLRLKPLLGRRPNSLPRVPPDAVVDRLVAAARAHRPTGATGELIRLRNVAVLETLCGSGLRVYELVSLRRGDLSAENRSAIVTGKGRKQRVVFFSPKARTAIAAYLVARDDEPDTAPLFAAHNADLPRPPAMATNAVRDVIELLCRRAGLEPKAVTPHRFRAWFATHMLEETGDLAATQDLLGHENPATTRQYAKLADRRLREVHARAFPP